MSITVADLLSAVTREFVHFSSELSAALSVVTVTPYQQEHSVPTIRLHCGSFMKRILSSLLFSGVLSIPGNAAATRRNSWKQIRAASVKVSLTSRKIWIGLGHRTPITGLKSQLKMDFTHSVHNITRETGSGPDANTRFSRLYEVGSPNPTAKRLQLHTTSTAKVVDDKNTGSSSAAGIAKKVWIKAEEAELISTVSFAFWETFCHHKHTWWLI